MHYAINWLTDHGVAGLPFLIRVPATLADVVTVALVFEMVRRNRTVKEAGFAALSVALSPALIVISGFHGNTDPVMVMLTLLSAYLLISGRPAVLAGASFMLALSVKLVPIVVLPALLVVVWRSGWRRVAGFAAGGALVAIPLWLPVVFLNWTAFQENVIGYRGVDVREWGLVKMATLTGVPNNLIEVGVEQGRYVVLALAAVVPALLAWRRPNHLGAAVGLSFAIFLLLSPAFGMQYLVWPLAAAYFINFWAASIFNVFTSAFVVVVYDRWNNAMPWGWYEGVAIRFTPKHLIMSFVTWALLAGLAAAGLHLMRRPKTSSAPLPAASPEAALQGSPQSG
jgi:hypothetical protein